MSRVRELSYRSANSALIRALGFLHRRFDVPPTYKIGPTGAAAEFEGCWFRYHPKEYGCTGNIDWIPDAENETRHFLFGRLKGNEVFYDIGAHGGVYTITLKHRFPQMAVHSFEPQPEDLLDNLALNSIPPGRVHSVALGAGAASVRMTTKKRSSNYVSVHGDRAVPMVALDDYARENHLPAPDWIKIDIEGLELPALRGAENLLRQSKPTIICEINHLSGRYGSTVADLIGYLASLGYSIHALTDGELRPVSEPLPYSANWNYWFLQTA
jgi:FkbM family methyltransferase